MTNYRVIQHQLKKKLAAGTITSADIPLAAEIVRKLGSSASDRALYSNIKRQAEENTQKESQFKDLTKQVVADVSEKKSELEGTHSVAEMRALLKQVEQQAAGRDDASSREVLDFARKRYAITRILNDLPADEKEGEFTDE